ncbi:hypothetical protein M3Y98_00452800 [Aphelenchoides besseyi]|nr:hypothetical protein M3Y98_00452800 [Aphelenchoides besseyi]KAI6207411.1 hypothetical protein M3Y96_00006200 [Aphelenchoides besseyi]
MSSSIIESLDGFNSAIMTFSHKFKCGDSTVSGFVFWNTQTSTLGCFHFGSNNHFEIVLDAEARCKIFKNCTLAEVEKKWNLSFEHLKVRKITEESAEIAYLMNKVAMLRIERPLVVGRRRDFINHLCLEIIGLQEHSKSLAPKDSPVVRRIRIAANPYQDPLYRNRRLRRKPEKLVFQGQLMAQQAIHSINLCSTVSDGNDSLSALLSDQQHPSFSEWSPSSVVLEMKVNEKAVVSIFCPPATSESETQPIEVVKFTENSIEFIRDLTPGSEKPSIERYGVQFTNVQFNPESVSNELFSESRRLFTCRVQLCYRDHVCGLRRFSDIQSYMSKKVPLDAYCERLTHNGIRALCRTCMTVLLETTDNNTMKFIPISNADGSDELEATATDDFTFHSCANQHKHDDCLKDGLLKTTTKEVAAATTQNLHNVPTVGKTFLSDSFLAIRKTDELSNISADKESRTVRCKGCTSELGRTAKINPNVFQMHMSGLILEDQNLSRDFITERFGSLERYFAFLLLRHSGIDSSLKLLFRTYERDPYLLVWLIEPIFVFAGGQLAEIETEIKPQPKQKGPKNSMPDFSVITSFCALKILYKVYDSETSNSNTRPCGVDSTVSYIDIPLFSCMQLEELLLRNSARLPSEMSFTVAKMDEDMEVKEIRFAETLSSNLPKTRRRALNRLHDYIRKTSTSKQFTPDSFDRMCRGLHYAMWMQDKMLNQEELSDEYGSLIELLSTENEIIEYMRSMLRTLSKHWMNIDRWRIDKFLMLLRRLFRAFFVHLHNKNWDDQLVEDAILFMQQTLITPEDGGVHEPIKLHFASIYLEELDYAGDLSPQQVITFLRPFAILMMKKNTSNYLFGSICTEIFGTILERFAADLEKEEFEPDEKLDGDEALKTIGKPLEFDYQAIADLLREVAASDTIPSKRRKRVEKLFNQFEKAEQNQNPFAEIIIPPKKDPIGKDRLEKATSQLIAQAKKIKRERAQFKKDRKRTRKQQELTAY